MTNDVGSISSGTYYSSANCGPFFGSPVWRDIRACPAFKHLTGCHMPSWAQRKVKAIHQNSSCQSMSVLHILCVEMDRFLPTPATFPLSIHVKKYRKCSMEDCCYSSWLGWKMAAHDGYCWLRLGIGCEMQKFDERRWPIPRNLIRLTFCIAAIQCCTRHVPSLEELRVHFLLPCYSYSFKAHLLGTGLSWNQQIHQLQCIDQSFCMFYHALKNRILHSTKTVVICYDIVDAWQMWEVIHVNSSSIL